MNVIMWFTLFKKMINCVSDLIQKVRNSPEPHNYFSNFGL